MQNEFKIVECPRDAMQGIGEWIPTTVKTEYLKSLYQVGFHSLDFGSFVSPKAVPQMKDTQETVLEMPSEGKTGLLAIIVNQQGAEKAVEFDNIQYLGFPLSISETFQWRNSKKNIDESFSELKKLKEIGDAHGKTMVVYVSMGFGNPYGDEYTVSGLLKFIVRIRNLGIEVISIADTTGLASPEQINIALKKVISENQDTEIGAHLHSVPNMAEEKILAVIDAGVFRMDGAIGGYGGCPFAEDKLTGNINTLKIIEVAEKCGMKIEMNHDMLESAKVLAHALFSRYH